MTRAVAPLNRRETHLVQAHLRPCLFLNWRFFDAARPPLRTAAASYAQDLVYTSPDLLPQITNRNTDASFSPSVVNRHVQSVIGTNPRLTQPISYNFNTSYSMHFDHTKAEVKRATRIKAGQFRVVVELPAESFSETHPQPELRPRRLGEAVVMFTGGQIRVLSYRRR